MTLERQLCAAVCATTLSMCSQSRLNLQIPDYGSVMSHRACARTMVARGAIVDADATTVHLLFFVCVGEAEVIFTLTALRSRQTRASHTPSADKRAMKKHVTPCSENLTLKST